MLDHDQFPFEFHTTLSRARDIIIEHGPKGGEAATLWPEHKRVADQLAVLSVVTEEAVYHGWAVNNFSHLLADTHYILSNIARQTPTLDQADLAIIENMRQVQTELPAVKPATDLQDEIAHIQAGRLHTESSALLKSHPPFPYLEFGDHYQVEGDPATPEQFARARRYLETIIEHFIEFGPWQEKTSTDLAYELAYHNAWGAFEAGKSGEQHQEITLGHLRALSRRRMLTLEEADQVDMEIYQAARHIDTLIEKAIAAESANLPLQILEAITTAFSESSELFEKTYDDLRFELGFQNDRAFEEDSEAVEVTLLQLLQASTAKIRAGGEDPARHHIHQLIEYAFIEQEAQRAIETLWPTMGNADLGTDHLPLLEAAVRGHLSEQGVTILDRLLERVRQSSAAVPGTPLQALSELGQESRQILPLSFSFHE